MNFQGRLAVVVADDLGKLKWSKEFDTFEEAKSSFDQTVHNMQCHPDCRCSDYYAYCDYGAHGESVSLVEDVAKLKVELAQLHGRDNRSTINKYLVKVQNNQSSTVTLENKQEP